MGLETIAPAGTPADLNADWPLVSDGLSTTDDHLRNIKLVLKNLNTDFLAISKVTVGLGNVSNYSNTTVITGAADTKFVLPSAVRAVFGTVKQTATYATSELALASIPAGSLFERIEQVGSGGPWRAYYYKLSL